MCVSWTTHTPPHCRNTYKFTGPRPQALAMAIWDHKCSLDTEAVTKEAPTIKTPIHIYETVFEGLLNTVSCCTRSMLAAVQLPTVHLVLTTHRNISMVIRYPWVKPGITNDRCQRTVVYWAQYIVYTIQYSRKSIADISHKAPHSPRHKAIEVILYVAKVMEGYGPTVPHVHVIVQEVCNRQTFLHARV